MHRQKVFLVFVAFFVLFSQFFAGGVHASLEELNQLPVEYKNKIYLTHYGDNWEDFVDKVKEFGFAGLTKQTTQNAQDNFRMELGGY